MLSMSFVRRYGIELHGTRKPSMPLYFKGPQFPHWCGNMVGCFALPRLLMWMKTGSTARVITEVPLSMNSVVVVGFSPNWKKLTHKKIK